MLTSPTFIESLIQTNYIAAFNNLEINPYKKYDAEVQFVLDEYWPGTS